MDTMAWYSDRQVFLGSTEPCWGCFLCDRELLRCFTWLVSRREGSPEYLKSGSRLVQDWEPEKQHHLLLQKG